MPSAITIPGTAHLSPHIDYFILRMSHSLWRIGHSMPEASSCLYHTTTTSCGVTIPSSWLWHIDCNLSVQKPIDCVIYWLYHTGCSISVTTQWLQPVGLNTDQRLPSSTADTVLQHSRTVVLCRSTCRVYAAMGGSNTSLRTCWLCHVSHNILAMLCLVWYYSYVIPAVTYPSLHHISVSHIVHTM